MSQRIPNINELLEKHVPNGTQWYEIRNQLSVASYPVEDYDTAVANAKHIMKIFPGVTTLHYVWKESGSMHEERLF